MLKFRNIVLFDAATCAVMGLALVLAAAPLASLTSIPVTILYFAGVALLPIAAFMAAVAVGRVRSIAGPVMVIGGNALWVVASVALMVGDWIVPSGFGYLFIGAQAAAVAVLAALELAAFRRARSDTGMRDRTDPSVA
jgi:hypothetical protein